MKSRLIGPGSALAVLLALGVVVAGCDNHKAQSGHSGASSVKIRIAVDKSHSATIGAALPDHMPSYAAVYPGADVKGVVTTDAMPVAPWTAVIQYDAPARPDDVLAFYRKNAAAAGLTTTADTNEGRALYYRAALVGGKGYVSITVAPKGDRTFVEEKYK